MLSHVTFICIYYNINAFTLAAEQSTIQYDTLNLAGVNRYCYELKCTIPGSLCSTNLADWLGTVCCDTRSTIQYDTLNLAGVNRYCYELKCTIPGSLCSTNLADWFGTVC